MRIVMMRKLKLLSSSFIMALTLAAPFATYAMEPEENHRAVTKKAALASRRSYTYLRAALELDTPILEAIYHSAPLRQFERFLNGKLIYKPNPYSDEGMVVMPIVDLPNSLNGEFDLSECGDTGKYLSINTGYRKGKRPENASKVEIWFTPPFLIEKNLSGSASNFKEIMDSWDVSNAPVGTFFTWGSWDDLGWYDYATKLTWEAYNDPRNNLNKIYIDAHGSQPHIPRSIHKQILHNEHYSKFSCHF
jgi:hypothetical protein